jgi:hypothetical protein
LIVLSDLVPRRCTTAAVSLFLSLLALAGCSNSNRGVTGTVGVGTGVALATPGDVTTLTMGQNITITASVVNDVDGKGVTWSIQQESDFNTAVPAGSLPAANQTPTSAIFFSPAAGVVGATQATITATSIADPSISASVTLITTGSAVFNQTTAFPANVNVAYSTSLSVTGGTAPFTWTLKSGSGPLPPGLTLSGSTSGLDSIAGTPTMAGTYSNIIVQVVDSSSSATPLYTAPLSITVNPQQTCIISGDYTLMVSGFRGGGGMTHIARIHIDPSGAITGEQDYKDGHRTTPDEQLLSTSNCTNRQTNSGQIQLEAPSGTLLYNFSVTPVNATSMASESARLQLIGSGSDSASGLMQRIDNPSPGASPSPPIGSFAFGMLGVAQQTPNGVHFATAGRFTVADASGALTDGQIDSNFPPAFPLPVKLDGTLSAPDSYGRGTATFNYGGQSSTFVYYVISPSKMYLMNMDPQNAAAGSPRLSGFLTPQVGTVSGTTLFDNTAFSQPTAPSSILSLWGALISAEPIAIQTLGRLSNGAPITGTNGGTLNALLDVAYQANALPNQQYAMQSYMVDSDGLGHGTLTIAPPPGNSTLMSYTLSFYLDGPGNGYVVQQGGAAGGPGGLLEAQYPPPASYYPVSIPGYFVGGTQFAMAHGPITLTALASFNFGQLTSSLTNANFYIDQTSGRGLGTLTQSGVGTAPAVLYIVSPTKLEVMRFGLRGVDANLDWFVQN